MNKQEIVDGLKANEYKPLWAMSNDEVEVLNEFRKFVESRRRASPYEFHDRGEWSLDYKTGVCRLHPDFELPVEKVAGYIYLDVVASPNKDRNTWVIPGVDHNGRFYDGLGIAFEIGPRIRGFGGVQFLSTNGVLTAYKNYLFFADSAGPFTPVKVRFWVDDVNKHKEEGE